ncbi:cupredoxin domain-containing protein [Piscinibacter terrae]|uniref:Cytochrome c oxidase subunit II n=1 Tax=Piscinibacter terrae TaxID=2496871 RepID=A0A3N7HK89_9BURK|nr:cupredoxin domain-containing protein [Albitalea terrae]RQP21396.1 cytochrome c oxidase subunit II [Albitalea terrae]
MSGAPVSSRRRALVWAAGLGLGGLGLRSVLAADERTIAVTAKKFVFEPDEIHLRVGETVTLVLTAPEVTMGFNAPDFQARTDIVPGQEARLKLTATRAGRFPFSCDVFCGSGHEQMDGVIVVEG